MVIGTSDASIGHFVVDPWMLKMENVAKEIYCVEDWACDAVVLCLHSPITPPKLIDCHFNDVGNCEILIVSLNFMRLQSFTINTRELDWRDQCVYQWATFLSLSYFNIPMITMLPNKRSMCLETIGSFFLFPRSDVS